MVNVVDISFENGTSHHFSLLNCSARGRNICATVASNSEAGLNASSM